MPGPAPRRFAVAAEHMRVFQRNLRTGKTEYREAYRSRILVLRARGIGPTEVARLVDCGRTTVRRIEHRYEAEGLDALRDRPRPGRPRKVSPPPEGADRRARLPAAG